MAAAYVASLHNKQNLFEKVDKYNIDFKICADYELLLRKRDKLRYLYLPTSIARMQVGGVSFLIRAIWETHNIRNYHCTIPCLINNVLFLKN